MFSAEGGRGHTARLVRIWLTTCAVPRIYDYLFRMTMLSFRVPEADAQAATRWATALGIDRSDLLREALRRHLVRLAASIEVGAYARSPLDAGELSLSAIADWGPAEEWSDWSDAVTTTAHETR